MTSVSSLVCKFWGGQRLFCSLYFSYETLEHVKSLQFFLKELGKIFGCLWAGNDGIFLKFSEAWNHSNYVSLPETYTGSGHSTFQHGWGRLQMCFYRRCSTWEERLIAPVSSQMLTGVQWCPREGHHEVEAAHGSLILWGPHHLPAGFSNEGISESLRQVSPCILCTLEQKPSAPQSSSPEKLERTTCILVSKAVAFRKTIYFTSAVSCKN